MHPHLMETLTYDRVREVNASASTASLTPVVRDLRLVLHTLAVRFDQLRHGTWRKHLIIAPASRAGPT